MAMSRWIWFIVLFAGLWLVALPFLGVSGSTLTMVLLTLAIILTLDYFKILKVFPFPLKKNIALLLLIGLWAFSAWSLGWFTGLVGLPGAAIPGVPTPAVTPVAGCVVSEELKGKTATIDVNAWDMESNTPYSSAVDVKTHVYKNGNSAADFVVTQTDTSGATITGFTVGDVIYAYSENSTYYADPVEGVCVESQRQPLAINAHTIIGESDAQITVYDDTGATALTAGDYGADYDMTQGADAEDAIYVKLKVNAANKAYQFCAWGVFLFKNISSVEPQNVEATYTKVGTPEHMSSLDVDINGTSGQSQHGAYVTYKASAPILLHEWDSIKEQFVVESDATNDPTGGGPAASDFNGFAIIAKDCAYAKGTDGKIYLDFYAHTTAEADVGLDETDTSPAGKEVGVTIEVD